ncbi:MAG TPA: hypothetical protein VJ841_02525 [Candidatus Saccharimonadales bacterium]|nr:hypothetical protein [Candidatus Saccharimonadales bacterium]
MPYQLTQQLHDPSHRCNAGIVCGFQRSFHGRWGRRNVTFAWGRAGFASLIAVAEGHLTEEQFRDAGSYEICKLGSSARPTDRSKTHRITQRGTTSATVAGAVHSGLPILHVDR